MRSRNGRIISTSCVGVDAATVTCGGTRPCGHQHLISGQALARVARQHHLQHRAEPRARRIAIAGLLDHPAAILFGAHQVGHRLMAFFDDQELGVARAHRRQSRQQPLPGDAVAHEVLAAIEREPRVGRSRGAHLDDRRQIAVVAAPHQHRRRAAAFADRPRASTRAAAPARNRVVRKRPARSRRTASRTPGLRSPRCRACASAARARSRGRGARAP